VSTALLDRPLPAAPDATGDVIHLWCCDENISMCGLDITDEPEVQPEEDEVLCPMCALVEDEGLPCPAPGCPGVIA
jgi:hypothetical protein